MGHIVNGKNILDQRPQPGRPVQNVDTQVVREVVTEKVVAKESSVDVESIASKVIEAIGDKLSKVQIQTVHPASKSGGFDDSKTMEQLAKSMTVQRGNSSSNFDNLGNISETQKDQEEVDQTIDILSGLQDL